MPLFAATELSGWGFLIDSRQRLLKTISRTVGYIVYCDFKDWNSKLWNGVTALFKGLKFVSKFLRESMKFNEFIIHNKVGTSLPSGTI